MPVKLAAPRDRANADVVIYDGQCRFCTAQVFTIARLDIAKRLAFLSLHDPLVQTLYPGLTFADLMQRMYVVTRDGRRFGGAEAVRYLSRRLALLWWLAPLIHFPGSRPVWAWIYLQIARRRYWFGRVDCADGTCSLPR
jgi:predicted DCC family thiol-disulfide oxidoreductase YuxK